MRSFSAVSPDLPEFSVAVSVVQIHRVRPEVGDYDVLVPCGNTGERQCLGHAGSGNAVKGSVLAAKGSGNTVGAQTTVSDNMVE